MILNPDIKQKLKDNGISYDKGILYLCKLFFKIDTDTECIFKEQFIKKMDEVGIYKFYDKYNIEWIIPLFITKLENKDFGWVTTEYCPLFGHKSGGYTDATKRMKKFFLEHPEVTKEDVINATTYYVNSVDNHKYLKEPRYFIEKGVGFSSTNDLLDWITKYKNEMEDLDIEKSNNRKIK